MTTPTKKSAGPAITAVAPWFGSKRTLAPDIIAELGEHTNYFEPFCGSCAVLLAKSPARQETVNDLHQDLTNLVRVLSIEHTARRLYQKVKGVIVSDVVLADAHANLKAPFSPDAVRETTASDLEPRESSAAVFQSLPVPSESLPGFFMG